ncbi:hypothetical protein NC653_030270 [Populus alba x Populus x berolinensis]|uniref:Uncharacterized protein n=1 Tax=Populus alba x Populus x berolinensis TaxID=444605 RepID=A0AAD6LVP0_9ROSI|nr:hypothetical protein NC653_030270 [Populus alba x Populus x berolinensis]
MAGRWSTSTFRQWLGLDLSFFTSSLWLSSSSVLRWWPSQLTASPSSWWVTRRLFELPESDVSREEYGDGIKQYGGEYGVANGRWPRYWVKG